MAPRGKPKKAKAEAKRARIRTPSKEAAKVRDLEERLAEALRLNAEALEQHTATAEILRVISESPTDAQPALDRMAESAARFCQAYDATIARLEGDHLLTVARHGPLDRAAGSSDKTVDHVTTAQAAFGFRVPIVRGTVAGRSVLERRAVHVVDLQAETDAFPEGSAIARSFGHRTTLSVPLLREGVPVGAITLRRAEAVAFSDKQIALLETFADQAAIAIENVRLFTELQASNRELTRTLEQQTATSEILRSISSSVIEVQPVFETIVNSGSRLLGGYSATMMLLRDDRLELVAYTSTGAEADTSLRQMFPLPLQNMPPAESAVRQRRTYVLDDVEAATDVTNEMREIVRARGWRSALFVPMRRDDAVIGLISVTRRVIGAFAHDEIALLETFAAQAVIAIENTRLFTELQEKNQALTQAHAQVTETLEQQTASAEILRVISRSPTDVQPVFDVIASSALHLCDGVAGFVFRHDGTLVHLAAFASAEGVDLEPLRHIFPAPPDRVTFAGRVMTMARPLYIGDIEHDPGAPPGLVAFAGANGFRSVFATPMLRDGQTIGAIAAMHRDGNAFTLEQRGLLQTFADQAVIAIENVRLFTELQTSNRELTTALDTQTATSDILRVISGSRTDVQPVFEAIVQSAVRLLRAHSGMLTRISGDQLELAAFTSIGDTYDTAMRTFWPRPLNSKGTHTLAIRDRAPVNIADAASDPRVPEEGRAVVRLRDIRSVISVPLLRHDEAIGTIAVNRREAGGFTDDEIALLQTFADQAVIAMENVRLFTELQAQTAALTRSVGQLTALGEVGQTVSSSLDLETVLATIVRRAVLLCAAAGGAIYEYDEAAEQFNLRAIEGLSEEYLEVARQTPQKKGEGATGRLAVTPEPVEIPDITAPDAYEGRLKDLLLRAGYRALLAVPLLREGRVLGSLVVLRTTTPGSFEPEVVSLLQAFATQSALAIQNARLFREIEDKSRQLEVASLHKSEFLANMSHELRTPLNAIIGYSELLEEEAGDLDGGRLVPDLQKIATAAKHQLSLINDILDLSKVEAGRMELELADFHLPSAIDNALTLVRERATRRGIALGATIDSSVGSIRADERKIKQVVLNLLSNALKFTAEGGRIDIGATMNDGMVEVSVADTGVGIAPEDQEAVFEEFRQVGTADKKVEGTGLGLALCRKLVELHGGRIWVKSRVGQGSRFTFTLPVTP